ncbi:MAG: protease modulator HflC [Hyphomonadaceae bacterium]|jgi:membrane protease subunit HflC|uniref:protease modulator HflC n=1 Tax=Aquidulcibacter sp. TaxID=2052990 RepID=UPI0022C4ABAC|nr:protease modulator HflC [Aquidulcibacter sp.]MCE2889987.1 protease modulator HflC [Hyphomonadaceae bacterium]MCZ8207748.1 protease modulator HflC [Aquidulcibacter sp.]
MNARTLPILGGMALGVMILANASLFTVSETQQAITLQFGQPKNFFNIDGTDPGLKVMIPFVQQREIYDRRILDLAPSGKSEVVTADQERLEVDSFARWRIVNPLRFYQAVRTEGRARDRLTSLLEASLRRVLGSAQSTDIISGRRSALMNSIRSEMNREATALGIQVVDVKIRAADLPPANQERVFERMRSERQQAAASVRAAGDRQAQEIRGGADRERAKIIADSYNQDPDFAAFYRSMQAYEKSLPAGTTIVTTPDSDFFRYFKSRRGEGGQ